MKRLRKDIHDVCEALAESTARISKSDHPLAYEMAKSVISKLCDGDKAAYSAAVQRYTRMVQQNQAAQSCA